MTEEELGRLLLRPLDGEPTEPNRVDVVKAMRDGRRGRRWRAFLMGTGVTALVAVAATGGVLAGGPADEMAPPVRPSVSASAPGEIIPPPQPPKVPAGYRTPSEPVMRAAPVAQSGQALPPEPVMPSSCTAKPLPLGKAKSAAVNAGDPSGTYHVGWTEPVAGGDHDVLVWRDGKLVDTVKQSRPKAVMEDINGSGVAVGGVSGYAPAPYLYRDGKVRRLPGAGVASAINDKGTIAGYWERAGRRWPQRWASPETHPELMPLADGAVAGSVRDIDENGTVAAILEIPYEGWRTYLWYADGSIQRLAPPVVDAAGIPSFTPIAFRFGWLYGEVEALDPGTGVFTGGVLIFRYEPVSGTWQQVNDPDGKGQVPPRGSRGLDPNAALVVGKEVLKLSRVASKVEGTTLTAVSEDAKVITGTTISQAAVLTHPASPTIWRCG
ncbi:hypothetical protein AB0M02_07510 [Actinoplanes sp. NPDC051861]|uniref:hypothetical protein n=1 Tax=Actinoplanes sp. NPDC051861 TaxID=3155170 RepID=UPI003421CD62